MNKLLFMVLGTTIALALPAAAQDMAMGSVELPDICKPAMTHDMGIMKMEMTGMDQAHQDLAMGMDETNAQMMQGMKRALHDSLTGLTTQPVDQLLASRFDRLMHYGKFKDASAA